MFRTTVSKRFIKNIDTLYICDAEKPQPEGYLKALKMLDLDKNEVVYIGDQMFLDIYGANKVSIPNIMVHYIEAPNEKRIGIKRYLEKFVLVFFNMNKTHKLDI